MASKSFLKNFGSLRYKNKDQCYLFFVFVVAIIYGGVLSQIPTEQFKDFSNYLTYANYSSDIFLKYYDKGFLQALFNEPLWLFINNFLNSFLPADSVVRTIIFFSSASTAWLILKNNLKNFFWLLFILIFPLVVKNYIVHLRQGAAIAIFLWGWYSSSRRWYWFLLLLTPFVHSSFFLVLSVLFFSNLMRELKFSFGVCTIGFICAGLAVGLSLSWATALLGARQSQQYDFDVAQVSGLGFLAWLCVFVLWQLEGRRFMRKHIFEAGLIVFYLSTYWLIEVTARIFESGVVLVLVAGLSLTFWRRSAFLLIVTFISAVNWLMRFDQPLIGFGVG